MTTTEVPGLDAGLVRELFAAVGAPEVEKLEVFAQIDSTNTYLRDQLPPAPGHCRVALADHQTAGRGRSHHRWISVPGRSLCLSVSYRFRQPPQDLPALTLALGVSVADVLQELGADGLRLKWPNDILVDDAKLGGILTESQCRNKDEVVVVAGVGLNVALPDRIEVEFDSPYATRAIDLKSILPTLPSREQLALQLVRAWCDTFRDFEVLGFEKFIRRYEVYDWLNGKSVTVATPQGEVAGLACGVADNGALLLETRDGQRQVTSGSIIAAAPA